MPGRDVSMRNSFLASSGTHTSRINSQTIPGIGRNGWRVSDFEKEG